ncbi:MAG: efflux RND transporter periplasmic adaptor subunit, partial [Acidovorax sp.]|nr:efflux RND transporter periplasmic adaptor subunit [Acidovorax sp.]
ERKDVLLVPNTALRFTPAQAAGAQAKPGAGGAKPAASGSSGGGIMSQLMPRMPRSGSGPRKPGAGAGMGDGAGDGAGKARQVWVLQDGTAKPIDVQVGISDGRHTEVTGEGLAPGMAVITDQRAAGAKP